MRETITFMKFLATVLITNSHYDSIYPKSINFIATGGSLGNALFFLISGYTLLHSCNRPFISWFKRRIVRLYPSVIISTLALMAFNPRQLNMLDIIRTFIYPTDFWFVSAILLFYILYYFIIKYFSKHIINIIIIIFVPYFYTYYNYLNISQWVIESTSTYFRWIFYFQIMLFGGILAVYKEKIELKRRIDLPILAILMAFYFGFKIVMDKVPFLMQFQFVEQLVTFPILFFMLKVFNERVVLRIFSLKFIGKVVTSLSKLTLEIYLIQIFIILKFSNMVFPISFILTTFTIVTISHCIHSLAEKSHKILSFATLKDNKQVSNR